MQLLEFLDITALEAGIFCLTGIAIGLDKTSIRGAAIIMIPFLASMLGGMMSVGFVLPALVLADIFALFYYRRKCEWKYILKLLPWSFAGIGIALFVGRNVSDDGFKRIMGIILIISLVLILLRELRKKEVRIPSNIYVSGPFGLGTGFSTMIGNAAGGLANVYLIAMNLPKEIFLGTGAWFFFIVNVSKLPLHAFVWKTITPRTLLLDLLMAPALFLGAFLGRKLAKRLPEKEFRYFLIGVTLFGAVRLLI
jgi:uncharacterized protein